jgi:hypothetical protein
MMNFGENVYKNKHFLTDKKNQSFCKYNMVFYEYKQSLVNASNVSLCTMFGISYIA